MADPGVPVAVTGTALIMAAIGWYGMLRAGLQALYDDHKGRQDANEDIKSLIRDLENQRRALEDWRRAWHISERTPTAVLQFLWGEERSKNIADQIDEIDSYQRRISKALELNTNLEAKIRGMSWLQRTRYKFTFVTMKKRYVQELGKKFPEKLKIIQSDSNAGWDLQRHTIARGIANMTPYYAQCAYLLAKIAMQIHVDADHLWNCLYTTRHDVVSILDLDLLDIFQASRDDQHITRITDMFVTRRLKLELLLAEAGSQQGELARVVLEGVSDSQAPATGTVNILRAAMSAPDLNQDWYLSYDGVIAFRIKPAVCRSPFERANRLHHTFGDLFADQSLPSHEAFGELFTSHALALGKFSRLRAAYELSQACLLFLRTAWLRGLCRCGVRCGSLTNTSQFTGHHFGLELMPLVHKPPLWSTPNTTDRSIVGVLNDTWCNQDEVFGWHGLNVPLRHLGLLIIELSMGLVIFPHTDHQSPGAPVTDIHLMCRTRQGELKWHTLDRRQLLRHVKRGFNNDPHAESAIEYCLTMSMPVAPSDEQFEKHLKEFYFRVVYPFQRLFNVQLYSDAFAG